MQSILKILIDFLQVLGPTVIGLLTVPVMSGIKKLLTIIDAWPAWVQRIVAVGIAAGLTALGAVLQIALPTDLHLFGTPEVQALLAGAIALAAHAGNKASTPS